MTVNKEKFTASHVTNIAGNHVAAKSVLAPVKLDLRVLQTLWDVRYQHKTYLQVNTLVYEPYSSRRCTVSVSSFAPSLLII